MPRILLDSISTSFKKTSTTYSKTILLLLLLLLLLLWIMYPFFQLSEVHEHVTIPAQNYMPFLFSEYYQCGLIARQCSLFCFLSRQSTQAPWNINRRKRKERRRLKLQRDQVSFKLETRAFHAQVLLFHHLFLRAASKYLLFLLAASSNLFLNY